MLSGELAWTLIWKEHWILPKRIKIQFPLMETVTASAEASRGSNQGTLKGEVSLYH
jgi:hypothetical protein